MAKQRDDLVKMPVVDAHIGEALVNYIIEHDLVQINDAGDAPILVWRINAYDQIGAFAVSCVGAHVYQKTCNCKVPW